MIKICAKKYYMSFPSLQRIELSDLQGLQQLDVTASKGSCATDRLMGQPLSLQNIRVMTLKRCSKLKSLFSVCIATTMIMLAELYINQCEELKQIISTEAEDDDYLNCTSIFPKLQSLDVVKCNKLEFIFPSTLSGGLHKLKSVNINKAVELKYVFGKYGDEECVSNENENNQIQIHLPALETLTVQDAPKMINIGAKKYYMSFPSLQRIELRDLQGLQQLDVTASKGSCATNCLMRQLLGLQNIREMKLYGCSKLKSLFSVSIATTMILLETLYIGRCEELKQIITNEEEDDDHFNYASIFPNLQSLNVYNCNKLEFIFPSTLFGGLHKLESINIYKAAELKYVFGKYGDEECVSNENENDQLEIHLPALETLKINKVPKMINICAKKYYLSFPSLQCIELEDLQEFNERSFLHLMAYLQGLQLNVTTPKDWMKIIKDVQKLTRLGVSFFKIEEVLDLEGVEIEGPEMTLNLKELRLINLSKLRHIWKGPKYILSLHNLQDLYIAACKKLRAIFSVSIVKSLPQLSELNIEDCDELVDIIEESDEDHLHQICFPKLDSIDIKRCNSLKCLFSISTCGMFPKLRRLDIKEASELEQAFIHKQDDMQKMTKMEEVFPGLFIVVLEKLPLLITICEGIDFRTLRFCKVDDCPKYQGTNHIQEGSENGDSENLATTNALPDFAESKKETVKDVDAKDPTPASEQQAPKYSTAEPQMTTTSLHNYNKTEKEIGKVVPDAGSRLAAMATTSSASQELEDEHKTIESTTQLRHEDFTETKTTTEASHKINTPLDDYSIDVILKERSEQGPTLEDVVVADLKTRNSSNVTCSFVSQVGGLQSDPPTLTYKETEKEVGKAIPASSLPATTSPDFEVIDGQPRTKQNLVASMKEKHDEQVSKGDDAIAIQSTDSESMKKTRSLEETEKVVRRHASQLPIAPISTNLKSAKEKAKGVYEKATATDTSPVATPFQSEFIRELPVKEAGDYSSVNKEDESENPIEAVLPQVVPSLHHQSQIANAGITSSPKLGICEIFPLVELKHGETALLAQALEQYPQLLLPREHRTHRIIAWSYRVLVDILVMLATKTPNTITPLEKSTLEANLSEAIVLGFDRAWVESVRAKVFGVDMSKVSKAKEEIQVIEMKLGDIDSQLLGLFDVRKKLIESMTMFRDIISTKDKPFGI